MTTPPHLPNPPQPLTLGAAARLDREKLLSPDAALALYGGVTASAPVLVVLAAGKGTRFGKDPKCVQPVRGLPLARHTIDAFRRFSPAPVVCLVGYRADEVAAALGPDNLYVRSDNPTGGTGFAAYEAFAVPGLAAADPLLIVTMGDRIVPPSVFRRLSEAHTMGGREAALTFLVAFYDPPRNHGKGRVVRDAHGRVTGLTEQRDIDALADPAERQRLDALTEGNCPLYAVRASVLRRHLAVLTNDNAQQQFYLTDIVAAIGREGGEIRTISTRREDPSYDLLCCDVTQPQDLAHLESILDRFGGLLLPGEALPGLAEIESAALALAKDRPAAQRASIARQLDLLLDTTAQARLGFRDGEPVALAVSGGRLRIAFMHPDMERFFGPAWQMPIGAATAEGDEQITLLVQGADDQQIHLYSTDPQYREKLDCIPANHPSMIPGREVAGLHAYEEFGTRMSERLLLALGYFSREEVERRRERQLPEPPPSLWVGNNMRRPFLLIGNALASLRTLREGPSSERVQATLGAETFGGLRIVSTGHIPQGGFSSSSALTVATKNALNVLFALDLKPEKLVELACQAEYGTGVRAGSLDQATEQQGQADQGTLISSNPRDKYGVLGAYPMPTDRIQVIFPYSVARDSESWRWSWGVYAAEETNASGRPTTGQMRKLTGKAAEMAAILVGLPLRTDFFKEIEADLMDDGLLTLANRQWIAGVLRDLPRLVTRQALRGMLEARRDGFGAQMAQERGLAPAEAARQAGERIEALFGGWEDPVLRRVNDAGAVIEERGVPLRAMVAYLFGEVAKNFYMIHHPEEWIACVTASQRGDRSVAIDPARLPPRAEMERTLDWEAGAAGSELLERWLERCGARPFDYNQGLDDAALSAAEPPEFHRLAGSNFFRGLALIDLAEAMLKRAFGGDAVAVRVNAAGQGDFFQVHLDLQKAGKDEVKEFLRLAFYQRFGLTHEPGFVEVHSGGGAVGVRLSRFDLLPRLIHRLRTFD